MSNDLFFNFNNEPVYVDHGFIWNNFHISRDDLCNSYKDIINKEGKKKLDIEKVVYYTDNSYAYRQENVTDRAQYSLKNIKRNKTKEKEEKRNIITADLENTTNQTNTLKVQKTVSTSQTAALQVTNATLVQAGVETTISVQPLGLGASSKYSFTVSDSKSEAKSKSETTTISDAMYVESPVPPHSIGYVDIVARVIDFEYELVFQGNFSGMIIFQDDDDKYHKEDFSKVIKQVSKRKHDVNYWDKVYTKFTLDNVLKFEGRSRQ